METPSKVNDDVHIDVSNEAQTAQENALEASAIQPQDASIPEAEKSISSEQIIVHIDELVDALDRESLLIVECPSSEMLKEVGVQKQHMLETYDSLMGQCGNLREFTSELNAEGKQKIRAAFESLRDAMKRNQRRLHVALEVSATLLDCFSSAVRDTAPQVKTYGPNGKIHKPDLRKHLAVTLKAEA